MNANKSADYDAIDGWAAEPGVGLILAAILLGPPALVIAVVLIWGGVR